MTANIQHVRIGAIAMSLKILSRFYTCFIVYLSMILDFNTHLHSSSLQVSLATVIFVASQSSLSEEVKTVIKQQLENVANGWTVYRIARQASRMVNSSAHTWPALPNIHLFTLTGHTEDIIDLRQGQYLKKKMCEGFCQILHLKHDEILSLIHRDAMNSPASCTRVCGPVWHQSTSTSGWTAWRSFPRRSSVWVT